MATKIIVDADPDSLAAAMKALEAYSNAEIAHAQTMKELTEKRDLAIQAATDAFSDAVKVADGELAKAKTAAVDAGVRFSEPAKRGGKRANRLSISDDVLPKVPAGEFTLDELAQSLGRKKTTANNYLKKMIEEKVVVAVGSRPNPDRQGRASKTYKLK